MDLNANYTNNFLNYINNKYNTSTINLIYATDDDALNFINKNYKNLFANGQKTPVFFSGINNLNMNKILPKDTFVGVYEVKEVKQNIELIKQFSPQTRDIYFVGDSSQTYDAIEKAIQKEEKNYKNITFHYINDDSILNIQSQLPNKPKSFIILTTIGHLKDSKNNTLLVQDSIKKIKENRNLILMTMEDSYMKKGVIGGYMTKGSAQGEKAAALVLQYLKTNSLTNVHSRLKSPNVYIFNSKEISDARVILSEYISRDAEIVGNDQNFIDKNKSLLLNIAAVLIAILLFTITLLYVFFKKAQSSQIKIVHNQELETLKQKLNAKDEFINKIISLGDIGYWRLDMQNNQLFLSPSLSDTLSIDSGIYKNDLDVLSYFVHENDKELYEKNLQEVKENQKSLTFEHKMVTSEKKLFNVKHLIYTQYIAHKPVLIFGIIKFEK